MEAMHEPKHQRSTRTQFIAFLHEIKQ